MAWEQLEEPVREGLTEGFADGVRTYSTLGSQGEVPEIAVSKGLDVTLGIWLSKDKARNELGMVKQGEIYVQYTPAR